MTTKRKTPARLEKVTASRKATFWAWVGEFAQVFFDHASRYVPLFAYFRARKVTKLKIMYKQHEITRHVIIINIEHFSFEDKDSPAKQEWALPMLLRSSGLFALPIASQEMPNEFETHVEEGAFDDRTEIFLRLSELKRDAATEQIPYSQQSEHDFFKFLLFHPGFVRPYLFLLENGNLRALWRNRDGEQVGLQFRGDESVQYVIFARRTGSQMVSRSAGRDLLSNIERLIEAHDVDKLMLTAAAA